MSYIPTSKKQTAPPTPSTPIRDAEAALTRWDSLAAVLRETHATIPALLAEIAGAEAELGAAQIDNQGVDHARARLADLRLRKSEATATRRSVLARMTGQRDALETARTAVRQQRSKYAAKAIEAFSARYSAALTELQKLWAEADQLGAALGVEVPAALPCRIGGIVPAGLHPWSTPDASKAHIERIPGGQTGAVDIDPTAAVFGKLAARLDMALARIAAIEGAARPKAPLLSNTRGYDPGAIYVVAREFTCALDSLPFSPGTLVDAGLVGGAGLLERLAAGRSVRLAGNTAVTAA